EARSPDGPVIVERCRRRRESIAFVEAQRHQPAAAANASAAGVRAPTKSRPSGIRIAFTSLLVTSCPCWFPTAIVGELANMARRGGGIDPTDKMATVDQSSPRVSTLSCGAVGLAGSVGAVGAVGGSIPAPGRSGLTNLRRIGPPAGGPTNRRRSVPSDCRVGTRSSLGDAACTTLEFGGG